jgi:hypothetical protein
MKTQTKIRLGAITVALNGLAAFMTMSPSAALAATCNPIELCDRPEPTCPSQAIINETCRNHAPPGCTFKLGACITNSEMCGIPDPWATLCTYQ